MANIRVKPVLSGHSKRRPKLVFKNDYYLMQVKSIAECSKRAFYNTFDHIQLPFVFKTFVLHIFEWPLKTGFTVQWLLLNRLSAQRVDMDSLHNYAQLHRKLNNYTTIT